MGPAWTRGEIEAPGGEKDMGGWRAAVYTPEQQARLGVTESGEPLNQVGGGGGYKEEFTGPPRAWATRPWHPIETIVQIEGADPICVPPRKTAQTAV